MDKFVFATSPLWAEIEAATYRPVSTDLVLRAAKATRDDHDLAKGRMEGADVLWSRIEALRKTWEREERDRG